MFNQPVHSSSKGDKPIGKVDEILGPVGSFYFTVNPAQGVQVDSFTKGDKIYMDKAFILPLVIFTNPQKPTGPKRIGGGISKGFNGRPQGNFGNRPQGNFGNRPQGNGYGNRPQGNNYGNRPQGNFGNRPQGGYNSQPRQ